MTRKENLTANNVQITHNTKDKNIEYLPLAPTKPLGKQFQLQLLQDSDGWEGSYLRLEPFPLYRAQLNKIIQNKEHLALKPNSITALSCRLDDLALSESSLHSKIPEPSTRDRWLDDLSREEIEEERSEYEIRRNRIRQFLDTIDAKVEEEMSSSDWYQELEHHGAFDWDIPDY